MRCAIHECKNSFIKKHETTEYLIFHRFPKGTDLVSQTIRREWIVRCKNPEKINPDNRYVCSAHFTANDYERDMQNELLGG